MKPLKITLPDGKSKDYDSGVTAQVIARDIGKRLEADAVAAKVNGKLYDLTRPIEEDAEIQIITRSSNEGLEVIRHSTAHLLAHAVKELYPETQITIGPVTDDGFYYDLDRETQFSPDDLAKLEKRMLEIQKRKLEVTRKQWGSKEEAADYFSGIGEAFKAEIIRDLPNEAVTTYQQGEFVDLCRGPHVPNTDRLGKFKLLSIAGAYWRGDENNKMLQRIYGTAFATQKELDTHLHQIEEAKKRDHRRLGPELGLFSFLPIAPSMPFYLPKGTTVLQLMTDFIRRETEAAGYQEVVCPQMMTTELWKTSGHLDHYKDNMFFIGHEDDAAFALKPMNCPGHLALFGSRKRSYRELPLRFSEYSRLHRNERAGVMHGLLRTKTFSQDDGHVFCTEEQLQEESQRFIEQTLRIYKAFGFDNVSIRLAKRSEEGDFMGAPQDWEKATEALENSLRASGKTYVVDLGEAAFYGPKIEFHVRDSIGRSWQCGTLQLDFNLPERFQISYIDKNNEHRRPHLLHRAIFGSFERFFGILIEHHAGHLPLWLAPCQVKILNVTEDQAGYAQSVADSLKSLGIRTELDLRGEKLGYKIREAQLERVPMMLVLGKKEAQSQTLSVRHHTGKVKNDLTLEAFEAYLKPMLNPELGGNH